MRWLGLHQEKVYVIERHLPAALVAVQNSGRPVDDGAGPAQKNTIAAFRQQQRECVHHQPAAGLSVRQGCEVIGLPRSTFYYRSASASKALDDERAGQSV
jgi:hypothetical protein